jgi:phage baseplate assembly protein gpV
MYKNLIRVGVVSSINYSSGCVRVSFEDRERVVSDELPLLSFEYNMPKVGESVLCLFLGNGMLNGFCLGKYYSDDNLPKTSDTYYKDLGEAFCKYDKNTKTLTISADNIVFDGNLSVSGNITATGTITGSNI